MDSQYGSAPRGPANPSQSISTGQSRSSSQAPPRMPASQLASQSTGPSTGQNAAGPAGQPGQTAPPPAAFSQLPPQMFTTAAQLLDLTDKKLMVVLRDGKKWVGVLRSWDQFGNIVLQEAVERIFAGNLMADTKPSNSGLFVIRGENIMLLGEIDLDKDDEVPAGYTLADEEQVRALQLQEESGRRAREKVKQARLRAYGFEGDKAEGLI